MRPLDEAKRRPLEALERENRAGVPHYVTGQHRAYSDPHGDEALLVYVDAMGWACLIPCERKGDTWEPMGLGLRHTANNVRTAWTALDRKFELSPDMLKALDNAEPVEDE